MSVIFSTRFNGGDWSEWTSTTIDRAAPLIGYGIDNLGSTACSHRLGGSFADLNKELASLAPPGAGISAFAVRLQYGVLANKSFQSNFPYFLSLRCEYNIPSVNIAALPGMSLAVLDNGSLRLFINNADYPQTSTNYDSASGVMPLDGSIHGIQLICTINAASVGYEVKLDDSTVLSGTHTATFANACGNYGYLPPPHIAPIDCGFWVDLAAINQIDVIQYRDPLCGFIDVMSNCAEVIVDSTAAATSYPASNAPQLTISTCYNTPTITGLTCNGDTSVIITGSGFTVDATIRLQGPSGGNATFTVGSFSSTAIELDNVNPPIISGGTYCVTMTNPCT